MDFKVNLIPDLTRVRSFCGDWVVTLSLIGEMLLSFTVLLVMSHLTWMMKLQLQISHLNRQNIYICLSWWWYPLSLSFLFHFPPLHLLFDISLSFHIFMDGHGGKSKSGTNCHSLHEVDLTSCWDVKDDSLSLLISGNASCLRSLTISNIYGVTDQVMMTISSSRARDNLTHLNISGCWRITEKGLRWVWWNGIIWFSFGEDRHKHFTFTFQSGS